MVMALAAVLLASTAHGQGEEGVEIVKLIRTPECEAGHYPVPMNFAGMKVHRAQAVLDHSAGGLRIAIADTGCDSLREPTTAEQTAIIMGPASPCGNPGTCITAGGLVGVVLEPVPIPMIMIVLIATVTAIVVSLVTVLVLNTVRRGP